MPSGNRYVMDVLGAVYTSLKTRIPGKYFSPVLHAGYLIFRRADVRDMQKDASWWKAA